MHRDTRIGLIIIGIAIVILVIAPPVLGFFSPAWRGFGIMGPGMMGGLGYGGIAWSWIMGIIMIVFWALIIAGIAILIRHAVSGHRFDTVIGRQDSALDILKRRYAQGEISKEEFEQKKKDII